MMKTILAIILFGLAFKASGAFSMKRPEQVPVLPDGVTTNDDKQDKAQQSAQKFLQQAETYMDCRPLNRRQHKALVAQLEILSESHAKRETTHLLDSDSVAES